LGRGRPQKFFQGGRETSTFFFIPSELLTMKYRWTLTKRFTLSTAQVKCPILWQQSQTHVSFAAIAGYRSIIFSKLSGDFPSKVRLFKEALPRSLTKTQNIALFYLKTHVCVT